MGTARSIYFAGAVSDEIPCLNRKIETKNIFAKLFHIIRGNSYFGKMRPAKIITAIIHTCNAVMVYYVFGHNTVALMAACMFAVNPANSQVSCWSSGGPYNTALFCVLLMFLLPQGAGILYAAALWCSTGSILSWLPWLFTHHWLYLFLGFVPFAFFGIRHVSQEIVSHKYLIKKGMNDLHPRKLVVVIKTFGFYVRLGLVPLHLGWDSPFLREYGHEEKATKRAYAINREFWWGIECVAAIGALIYLFWGSAVAFGLVWWVSNILVWTNLISGSGRATERYQYIANPGLMLAVSALLYMCGPAIFCAGTAFLVGAYAVKLYSYTLAYHDPWFHILHIITEQPNCTTGWIRTGCDLAKERNFPIALKYFKEAERIGGLDFVLAFDEAVVMMCLGDIVQARVYCEYAKNTIKTRLDNNYAEQMAWLVKTIGEAEESLKKQGNFSLPQIVLLTIN